MSVFQAQHDARARETAALDAAAQHQLVIRNLQDEIDAQRALHGAEMLLAETEQAKLAMQLLTGDEATPWVAIGRTLIKGLMEKHGAPKGSTYRFILTPSASGFRKHFNSNGPEPFPPALRRLLEAVQALPRAELLRPPTENPAGHWCLTIPVWGNPLVSDQAGTLECRDAAVPFKSAKNMSTLWEILRMYYTVRDMTQQVWLQQGRHLMGYYAFMAMPQQYDALEKIEALMAEINSIRPDLMQEARDRYWVVVPDSLAGRRTFPDPGRIMAEIPEIMGWRPPRGDPITPASFNVRKATALQRAALPRPQQVKFEQFAALAGAEDEVRAVLDMLRRAWSLPWDNKFMEPMWMLVLNGVASPERFGRSVQRCGCNRVAGAGRAHIFHECPASQALYTAIQTELSAVLGSPVTLTRRHVWMAEKPVQALHQGIWDLVCLAAIAAMDRGRAYLFKRVRSGTPPGQTLGAAAGRKVVADFFGNLADFCGLNVAPVEWQFQVPVDHPFLTFDSERARWRVRLSGELSSE
jgi:hypothetical protein